MAKDCKYCRTTPNGGDVSCASLKAAHECPWMTASDWAAFENEASRAKLNHKDVVRTKRRTEIRMRAAIDGLQDIIQQSSEKFAVNRAIEAMKQINAVVGGS